MRNTVDVDIRTTGMNTIPTILQDEQRKYPRRVEKKTFPVRGDILILLFSLVAPSKARTNLMRHYPWDLAIHLAMQQSVWIAFTRSFVRLRSAPTAIWLMVCGRRIKGLGRCNPILDSVRTECKVKFWESQDLDRGCQGIFTSKTFIVDFTRDA